MDQWFLYIDETGDFESPKKRHGVGGYLVSTRHEPAHEAQLGPRLRRVGAHLPWPLHASLLRSPAMHALWGGASPPPASGLTVERFRAAEKVMKKREARAFHRATGMLAKGREPAYDDVCALNRALGAHDPSTYAAFQDEAARVGALVDELLEDVIGSASVAGLGCAVYASLSARCCAQLPDRIARYEACVRAVVQRAAATLAARGGQHRLILRLAAWPRETAPLDDWTNPQWLRSLVDESVTDWAGPLAAIEVRVDDNAVVHMRGTRSGALILADLVVRSMRLATGSSRRRSWQEVAERAETHGTPAMAARPPGSSRLPAALTSGVASVRNAARLGGRSVAPPFGPQAARWAEEQDEMWQAAMPISNRGAE